MVKETANLQDVSVYMSISALLIYRFSQLIVENNVDYWSGCGILSVILATEYTVSRVDGITQRSNGFKTKIGSPIAAIWAKKKGSKTHSVDKIVECDRF